MAKVYIELQSGEEVAYEESAVLSLSKRDQLPEGKRFRMEGSDEWRPVSDLLVTLESKPNEHSTPRLGQSVITGALQGFLFLAMIVCLISIWADVALIRHVLDGLPQEESVANSVRLERIFLSRIALAVAVEILFLCWFYRAIQTCRQDGALVSVSPGWGVAVFFIPILNIYRPYQVMKEIWCAKHESTGESNIRSGVITFWWALVWLRIISGLAAMGGPEVSSKADIVGLAGLSILSTLFYLLSTLVTWFIVEHVSSGHREMGGDS